MTTYGVFLMSAVTLNAAGRPIRARQVSIDVFAAMS